MKTATKRVLPADVYDTLELSALAYGGIGAGRAFDCPDGDPVCISGHIYFAAADLNDEEEMRNALLLGHEAPIDVNDPAVRRINRRRGAPLNARVPFDLWRAELGVERGA